MSCQKVQESISAHLDGKLSEERAEAVARHLAGCRQCALRSEQVAGLRAMLRSMPPAAPPKHLATRLRVIASHERARRASRVTWSGWLGNMFAPLALFANNLMRPLALPFAGGLLSALCLFGILMPSLLFQYSLHNDVPTGFYTEASLAEITPLGFMDYETVIELTINEKGQITDYSVPSGKLDPALEAKLANLVMFSVGTPATFFGQPMTGKVLISFRRSQIFVRG